MNTPTTQQQGGKDKPNKMAKTGTNIAIKAGKAGTEGIGKSAKTCSDGTGRSAKINTDINKSAKINTDGTGKSAKIGTDGNNKSAKSGGEGINKSAKSGLDSSNKATSHGSKTGPDGTGKSAPHGSKAGTDGSGAADGVVSKLQPTAEQIRLAQMIETKSAEDPMLQDKIKQVVELTGKTSDEAIVALHDCDNDTTRAINTLLEGDDQGEWKTSGKKKKPPQPTKAVEAEPAPVNNKENRNGPERNGVERNERDSRERDSFRSRGPPRMNRGRGRERERNERNQEDSTRDRDRSGERRGRGRMMNGFGRPSGRGRGGGPRSRTFQSRGPPRDGDRDGDGFPQSIDTWNNSTADGGEKMNVGNWGDGFPAAEDWDNEDWNVSLVETKVFTPSVSVGNALAEETPSSGSNLGQSLDLSALLQKPSQNEASEQSMTSGLSVSPHQSTFLSQFNQQATDSLKATLGVSNLSSMTQSSQLSSSSGPPSLGKSPSSVFPGSSSSNQSGLGGSLPPSQSVMVRMQGATVLPGSMQGSASLQTSLQGGGSGLPSSMQSQHLQSQHQSLQSQHQTLQSQHSGLSQSGSLQSQHGSLQSMQSLQSLQSQHSSLQSQPSLQSLQAQHGSIIPQQGMTGQYNSNQSSAVMQSRTKPMKPRVAPTSKIPSSAVEMPDDVITTLDVQFGGLEFGSDSTPFEYGVSETSTNYQTSTVSSSPPSNDISNITSQLNSSMAALSNSSSTQSYGPNTGSSQSYGQSTGSSQSYGQNSSSSQSYGQNSNSSQAYGQSSASSQSYGQSAGSKPSNLSSTGPSQAYVPSPKPSALSSANPEPLSGRTSQGPLSSIQQPQSASTGLPQATTGGLNAQTTSQKLVSSDPSPYSVQAERKSAPTYGSQRSSLDTLPSSKPDPSMSAYTGPSSYQSSYQSQKQTSYSHQMTSASSHQPTSLATSQSQVSGYGSSQANQNSSSYATQSSNQSASPAGTGQQYSGVSTVSNTGYTSSTPAYSAHSSYGQSAVPYTQSSASYGNSQAYGATNSQGSYGSNAASAQQPSYGASNSGSASGPQSYGAANSALHGSANNALHSANKINSSLSTSVKDSSMDATSQHVYDSIHSTGSSSLSTSTVTTTASSLTSSSVAGSTLGHSTSSAAAAGSVKTSIASGKTGVANVPPGVPPMLGHQQYFMSQAAGLPFYGVQQPVYSYEEIQLLQQRLPVPTAGYYDVSYQPTSLTSRDAGLANVAYSVLGMPGSEGKYSRGDSNSSPVPTSLAQQLTPTQHQQQQQFINPGALPPGYGYYYTGGMMPGSFTQYGAPIFPVPPTNAHTHTTGAQYQKQATYSSHGYNSGYDQLTQVQDYSKGGYSTGGQSQGKAGVSAGSSVSSMGADISGSVYSKGHSQLNKEVFQQFSQAEPFFDYGSSYFKSAGSTARSHLPFMLFLPHDEYAVPSLSQTFEKPGFHHAGTPPPFNMAGAGTGPSTAYAPTFIPMLAHHQQHHSPMLHPQLHQETGPIQGSQQAPRGVAQSTGQSTKTGISSKPYNAASYWATS